jgi:hypothetical protein
MIRALTIVAAIAALAVSAGPAAAYSMGSGGDRPIESVSFVKAPPMPRGDIVVTKPTDVASTSLRRGSSVSGLQGLQDTLISGWAAKARSRNGHRPHKGHGTVTTTWDITSNLKG